MTDIEESAPPLQALAPASFAPSRRQLLITAGTFAAFSAFLDQFVTAGAATAAGYTQYQLPFVEARINVTFGQITPSSPPPDGHKGTDWTWGGCTGTDIPAVASGTVAATGTGYVHGYDYGNWAEISHSDGMRTFYAHMQSASTISGAVNRGAVVGKVGASGGATGAHFHLGMYNNGTPVDPIAWIKSHTAPEGNDMKLFVIRNADTGGMYLAGLNIWWPIPDANYVNLIQSRGVTWNDSSSQLWKGVPGSEFALWKSIYAPGAPN